MTNDHDEIDTLLNSSTSTGQATFHPVHYTTGQAGQADMRPHGVSSKH